MSDNSRPDSEGYRERYLEYLQSDHWKNLKKMSFAIYGCKCLICKSNEPVDGHHLVYRNLIDVHPNEVIPLCREHHEEVHRREGEGIFSGLYRHMCPNDKRKALLKSFGLKDPVAGKRINTRAPKIDKPKRKSKKREKKATRDLDPFLYDEGGKKRPKKEIRKLRRARHLAKREAKKQKTPHTVTLVGILQTPERFVFDFGQISSRQAKVLSVPSQLLTR